MKAAIYCRVGTDNQNVVAQFIGFASSVIARSEIPRLRLGTGSAIWARDGEIATHQTGIRYPIPVDVRHEPTFRGQLKGAASRAAK